MHENGVKPYLTAVNSPLEIHPKQEMYSTEKESHTEGQAVNFIIQGSAADMCIASLVPSEALLACEKKQNAHLLSGSFGLCQTPI